MELFTVNTERLTLRRIRASDAEELYKIWSNPVNEKYMRDGVDSLEHMKLIIDMQDRDENSFLYVAILEDKIIGSCVFALTDEENQLNLGYSIDEEFWGMGYGTEMVETIIELGIYNGFTSFIADCAVENIASEKLMEKLGMEFISYGEFTQLKTGKVFKSKNYKLEIF